MSEELVARLALLAAQGQTVSYGALARELGWRVSHLTEALEALMEEDARTGQPQRAALMEGRLTGGMPAQGFFDKAAALGLDVSAPAAFVQRERARLYTQEP